MNFKIFLATVFLSSSIPLACFAQSSTDTTRVGEANGSTADTPKKEDPPKLEPVKIKKKTGVPLTDAEKKLLKQYIESE